jgi:class 3 adenylate cyclase
MQQGIDPTTIGVQLVPRVVMVCDIVGFTTLVQRLEPREVVTLVNRFVALCDDAITAAGGVVNKLIGDGLIAYFEQSRIDAALEAALDILDVLEQRCADASPGTAACDLRAGIGMALGEVVEGDMGSRAKRDYTIIGEAVNLASRLEALTRELPSQLAVSPEVKAASSQPWQWRSLGVHPIKGYAEGMEIFTPSASRR